MICIKAEKNKKKHIKIQKTLKSISKVYKNNSEFQNNKELEYPFLQLRNTNCSLKLLNL